MIGKSSSGKRVKIIAVVLGVLLFAGLLGSGRIIRLYRVITLFDSDKIVENFRSMGETLDSRVIHRGGEVFEFRRAERALPETYVFGGAAKKIAPFMERTGTTGIVVVRDDTILHERYYLGNTETSKAISWSVAK